METTERTTAPELGQASGNPEITSIASLSAGLAWSLLRPEEQRLVLEYVEIVRERYLKEKSHTAQEEMPAQAK